MAWRASAAVADVTDREAVARVIGEVSEVLGPIDILINNAGAEDGPAGPEPALGARLRDRCQSDTIRRRSAAHSRPAPPTSGYHRGGSRMKSRTCIIGEGPKGRRSAKISESDHGRVAVSVCGRR